MEGEADAIDRKRLARRSREAQMQFRHLRLGGSGSVTLRSSQASTPSAATAGAAGRPAASPSRHSSTAPSGTALPPAAIRGARTSASPPRKLQRAKPGTITVSALTFAKRPAKTRGLRSMSSRPFDSQWTSVNSVTT